MKACLSAVPANLQAVAQQVARPSTRTLSSQRTGKQQGLQQQIEASPRQALQRQRVGASLPQAPIQRVIGHIGIDKGSANARTAEAFIRRFEVERMVEHIESKTPATTKVELKEAGAKSVPITAGDNWLTGHGDMESIGRLDEHALYERLDFSGLAQGQTATIHLITCSASYLNAGNLARELRRKIQSDQANAGKMIIVKAAPKFVVYTAGLEASFAAESVDDRIDALQVGLKETEKEIDKEVSSRLHKVLEKAFAEPELSSKLTGKALDAAVKGYKGGVGNASVQKSLFDKTITSAEQLWATINRHHEKQEGKFFSNLEGLVRGIDMPSLTADYQAVLDAMQDRSRRAWFDFEESLKQLIATDASVAPTGTLTATQADRKAIKTALYERKTSYEKVNVGWIERSSKAIYKKNKYD